MAFSRLAAKEDIPILKALWKQRFQDSDTFIDYFFQHRFLPFFSVITEEDGELRNMMHAYPVTLHFRGKQISSALLSGFATDSRYERRGFLSSSFHFLYRHLYQQGMQTVVLTPVALPYYYAFGCFGATRSTFITAEHIPLVSCTETKAAILSPTEQAFLLYPCYQQKMRQYSGSIARSFADFQTKMMDYEADGGKCIALFSKNVVTAYSIYYEYQDTLRAEETLALDAQSEKQIANALFSLHTGSKLSMKLPPDTSFSPDFCIKERRPQGVSGMINVSSLLKALSCAVPYTVKIQDTILPENCGVFNFKGERVNTDPQIILSAGHFLQFLEGYASLKELGNDGYAEIIDEKAAEHLDTLLPKQKCFIVDEY